MPAYNFKARFADDVENGRKRQTIRKNRKRQTKPRETLYLYTGMRSKKCRKLLEVTCKSVEPIKIYSDLRIRVGKKQLTIVDVEALALSDGFKNVSEFYNFFENQYGLPFNGELIKW